MKRLLAICFLIVGMCCNAFTATAPTQSPKSFIERSGKLYRIASLYPGVNVNDASSDQTGIANLLADTSIKNIYFPPGDYTLPSSFNNSVSNRTFWWDAGARVIGVLHLAIGATSTDTVRNITSIGIPVVTSRVGTYNCKNVNADGFIVGDSSGGGTGVHIYKGSRDVHIGKLYIRNTPGNIYALGIDQDSTGLAYEPSNITIDEVIIDDADSSAIRMANTRYVTLGKVTIRGYDKLDGIKLFNTNWTTIKELYISGARTTTSGVSALNMENDTGSYIGLARIDVDSVTNTAITVSGGFQTAIGMAFLTSTDTVGSKFGLFVNNSKQFRADYVYAKGFNQGIRLVSDTIIRIDDMMLESNKIGYVGSLDTALTFSSITYLNNTDTATGTVPSLTAGVKGGLSGPGSSVSGINIVGSGQLGDLSADSIQPKDGITSGFLRLIANNGTAARGSGIYFGSTLSTIERVYAGIHPFLFTGADSGQGGLSFLVRQSQTDSTLKRVFICRYDGRLCIGVDTATEYRLPIARYSGTGIGVLADSTGKGNVYWLRIDTLTGGGGSGDDVKVDTTLASGGEFDPTAPVFKVDSGLGLNRIGSTDSIKVFLKTGGILKGHFDTTSFGYVFDTAVAKSIIYAPLITTRTSNSTDTLKIGSNGQNPSVAVVTGTTGKFHIIEDGALQWIYSGDSLNGTADSGVITGLRLVKVGSTTYITDGLVQTIAVIAQSVSSGSALTLDFIDSLVLNHGGRNILNIYGTVDTLGDSTTHMTIGENTRFQIHVDGISADTVSTLRLIWDTVGGHAWRFSENLPPDSSFDMHVRISGVDTTVPILYSALAGGGGGSGDIEGVTAGTGLTDGGTTGTVTLNAVGGYGLFTGADSLSVDTVSSTGIATKLFVRDSSTYTKLWVDTTGAAGNAGRHAIVPDSVILREHPTGGLKLNFTDSAGPDVITFGIETNMVTSAMITNFTLTKLDTDTTSSDFVFDDAYHITSAVADSEYASIYYVRTKIGDTAAVLRTYVLAQIADSLADIDSTNINNGGASFPSDLAAFTSTEFFAKVTGETGSGAVVGGTAPTVSTLTATGHTTADSASARQWILRDTASGSEVIHIYAPGLSADWKLVLPADDGSANEVTITNGSGVLDFVAADSNILQGVSLPSDVAGFTSAELAAKLSNETGTGVAVFMTALQDSSRDAAGDSANAYAGTGRRVEYPITNWSTALWNFTGAAVRQDSSWYWTDPMSVGDSTSAGYRADSVQYIWADSNINDATDTILHRGFIDLPENIYIDTLYVVAKSSDTALEFDEIKVFVDSTNASTIGGTPDLLRDITTDVDLTTTITRTAIVLSTGNTTLYSGGRLSVWMLVSTQHASAANDVLKCVRVTVKGRLRK